MVEHEHRVNPSAFRQRRRDLLACALLATNLFLILFSYYLLKTVRESWILVAPEGVFFTGPKLKSLATALQALLLLALVPFYARLSQRIEPRRLLLRFTGYFVLCMLGFALALGLSLPYFGFAFYVWLGTFNVAIIAQFWSFATSVFSRDEAMKLFPTIGFGATAGGFVGAKAAGLLFSFGLSLPAIIVLAAAILILHCGIYLWVGRLRRSARGETTGKEDALSGHARAGSRLEGEEGRAIDGIRLVLRDAYLRWIVALIVLLSVVNTTGEYLLSEAVVLEAKRALALAGEVDPRAFTAAFIHDFYSDFYLAVNIAAIVLQVFVVGRLIRMGGIRAALFILPILSFFAYGLVASSASLLLIKWVKIIENGSDYSVMNTARALLFLPTSEEEKWRARQVVDTIFVRFGDMLSFVLVALVGLLNLPLSVLALLNLALVLVWAFAALQVNRGFELRSAGGLAQLASR